jgi:hypothetical protein
MSTNTKKILIESECHEIVIVRVGTKSEVREFCKACTSETEMLTLDEAVSRLGMSALKIMEQVRSFRIHYRETVNGHLLICRASLANLVESIFNKEIL